MIRGALVGLEYDIRNNSPNILMWIRTEEGERKSIRIKDPPSPYFYTTEEPYDHKLIKDIEKTDNIPLYSNNDVWKVETHIPKSVGILRSKFSPHYEADILYPIRYLIDTGLKYGIRISDDGDIEPIETDVEPKQLYLDIETIDKSATSRIDSAPVEINVIGCYIPSKDKRVQFVLDNELIKDRDTVIKYNKEEEMIKDFIELIKEEDPDIIIGKYMTGFDMPYLVNRSKKLGIKIEDISPMGKLRNGNDFKIYGRETLDWENYYERKKSTVPESHRLHDILEDELGWEPVEIDNFKECWNNNPERLLKRNKHDIEGPAKIDKKLNIIKFFNELRKLVGCRLKDTKYMGRLADYYYLRRLYNTKWISPSKRTFESSKSFAGAKVLDPKRGRWERVIVIDLSSAYPSLMRTFNISPETFIINKQDKEDIPSISMEGASFRTDIKGIIPKIQEDLLKKREKKKLLMKKASTKEEEEMYDIEQTAVKFLANCFTGDTEVITPNGIVNIRDLERGDMVYSINKDTGDVEIKPVIKVWKYPNYEGNIYHIRNYNNLDFKVTPNHKMLVRNSRNRTSKNFDFCEAKNLKNNISYECMDHNKIEGKKKKIYKLLYDKNINILLFPKKKYTKVPEYLDKDNYSYHPTRKSIYYRTNTSILMENYTDINKKYDIYLQKRRQGSIIPLEYDIRDFLKLIAWYITEGSLYHVEPIKYDSTNRGESFNVQITQKQDTKFNMEIRRLLERMKIPFHNNGNGKQIEISNDILYKYLEKKCGKKSHNKKIPKFIFELSYDLKKIFFDELLKGDGHSNKKKYSTVSDHLKDDMSKLMIHIGQRPLISRDSNTWRIHCNVKNKGHFRMYRNSEREKAKDGVYCVTVKDNHTVLAGRNGKFQWIGQSFYGLLGQVKSRYFQYTIAEGVTGVIRKIIETIAKELEKGGFNIVFGDTDSIGCSDKKIDPQILVDRANDIIDNFMLEQYNVEDHRIRMDLDKIYTSMIIREKKLYAGKKEDGTLVKKGIASRRSDTAPIARRLQENMLDQMLEGEDKDIIIDDIKEEINSIRNGKYGLKELGVPTKFKKHPTNYDVTNQRYKIYDRAKKYQDITFSPGDKPKRVICKTIGTVAGWKDSDLGDLVIDYDKMIEKYIKKKLKPFTDIYKIDWKQNFEGQQKIDEIL